MNVQTRSWCFTINNWTQDQWDELAVLFRGPRVTYAVVGKETAATTGTPHLQGYVCFATRRRFTSVRTLLPNGVHVEAARDPNASREYCKKDGQWTEWGTFPENIGRGKKSDLERFCAWIQERGEYPSQREICRQWPTVYARHGPALPAIIAANLPEPPDTDGELRPWQANLVEILDSEPDNRTIYFYVDPEGNSGKSWFCRYAESRYKCQTLRVGKRDDLAHAIDPYNSIYFFDVPRL